MTRGGFLYWYRPSDGKRIAAVLVTSALFLIAGCLLVAFAWRGAADVNVRVALGIIGGAMTVAGPLSAIIRLQRLMRNDAFIGARLDSLVVGSATGERLWPWAEVRTFGAAQSSSHEAQITIELADGEVVWTETQISVPRARRLAKRLNHVRTRVLLLGR